MPFWTVDKKFYFIIVCWFFWPTSLEPDYNQNRLKSWIYYIYLSKVLNSFQKNWADFPPKASHYSTLVHLSIKGAKEEPTD